MPTAKRGPKQLSAAEKFALLSVSLGSPAPMAGIFVLPAGSRSWPPVNISEEDRRQCTFSPEDYDCNTAGHDGAPLRCGKCGYFPEGCNYRG